MQILVKKSDGTLEPLDFNKIRTALRRAGASYPLIEEVIDNIQQEIKPNISTKQIYKLAFEALDKLEPESAARFGLKNALIKMGPDGYPFETFIAALLKGRNYQTQTRIILAGKCITHEIDVFATRQEENKTRKIIIECKFHNAPHIKCSIQSALYTWARYLDIKEVNPDIDNCWLVTNTKFSGDVIQYADCVGLKLLGWSFPKHESIQQRIEENKLYPITLIKGLKREEFVKLHNNQIILLKELVNTPTQKLLTIGLKEKRIEKLKEIATKILSK
ncbi:MAG: ATP cone domain-containing protein [Candidatus Micrarchaeota archaeon]|nr:ATP cone domain-containing protein [Candidatus Micrarchaeota archaeon]